MSERHIYHLRVVAPSNDIAHLVMSELDGDRLFELAGVQLDGIAQRDDGRADLLLSCHDHAEDVWAAMALFAQWRCFGRAIWYDNQCGELHACALVYDPETETSSVEPASIVAIGDEAHSELAGIIFSGMGPEVPALAQLIASY